MRTEGDTPPPGAITVARAMEITGYASSHLHKLIDKGVLTSFRVRAPRALGGPMFLAYVLEGEARALARSDGPRDGEATICAAAQVVGVYPGVIRRWAASGKITSRRVEREWRDHMTDRPAWMTPPDRRRARVAIYVKLAEVQARAAAQAEAKAEAAKPKPKPVSFPIERLPSIPLALEIKAWKQNRRAAAL